MRPWALILALLASASLHAEATKQYVSLNGTRLLSKPAAFAKANATLKKGTVVWADAAKNGYVKVKVDDGGATGYLNVRALQASKPKLSASAKKSSDASAEEVAAATKGFNKQIEADLRKDGKSEDNYGKLDKLIERSKVEDPQGGGEGFREKGQLGEFKKGGD
jgi:hypothetical protein